MMTVAEIFELQDGDAVMIKWGGGNGPHHYMVRWWGGRPYAVLHRAPEQLVDPIAHSKEDVRCLHQVERA